MHTNAVIGKEVTELFYHKPHAKSYFLGCSQGGRQGIGAAEKFPGDFDGIVAGAPALDFNNLISWRASFYPITGSSSDPSFIKPELWSGLIHDEVLRQCDGLDGVKDGIIEHPDLCEFDPKAIECHGDSTARCLTTMQVDQVRKIFSPLTYEDGTIIYPAMQTGSEMKAIDRLYAGKPFSDSQVSFEIPSDIFLPNIIVGLVQECYLFKSFVAALRLQSRKGRQSFGSSEPIQYTNIPFSPATFPIIRGEDYNVPRHARSANNKLHYIQMV
jgi:hypothetical protein